MHVHYGNSSVVQWLGLHAFIAVACVQSLVGELRSHKPASVAKKKKITANPKNHTSQVKDFSAFLCVGRCKSLGVLQFNSNLAPTPQVPTSSPGCHLCF